MTNDYASTLDSYADRVGDWMQLSDGRALYPNDPRPEDFHIENIAHALSQICRFGGHSLSFYSVAQHSVLVSRICPPHLALEGLMHDAAEAYIGDMIRPLKHDNSTLGRAYEAVERKIEIALSVRFNLQGYIWTADPYGWPSDVKHADNVILATEARDVMAPPPQPWNTLPLPLEERIVPLTSSEAKTLFWDTYMELTKHRGTETRTRPA